MAESFYCATPLRVDDAAAAFPLVNMLHPDLTMELWRKFVRSATRLSPRRAGVMAIRDRRSYIHALFAYRVDDDVTHGHLLRLTLLVMGRLPGGVLTQAIIARAEELAAEFGGASIALDVAIDGLSSADFEAVRGAGFQTGGVVLIRAAHGDAAPLDANQCAGLGSRAVTIHAPGRPF